MTSTYSIPPQNFYRAAAPLTVDTAHAQQKYFDTEEDGCSILDDSILDHSGLDSGLEMSPPMVDSRRDSFAVGPSLFSPKHGHEEWHAAVEMQSVGSNNPFQMDHSAVSTNPFFKMEPAQHHGQQQHHSGAQVPFVPQTHAQSPWPMASTTAAHFDGLPAEFDVQAPVFQRPVTTQAQQVQGQFPVQTQGPTPFSNPTNQVPAMYAPGSGMSSPSKDQPWMQHQAAKRASGSSGSGGGGGSPGSPGIRGHNDLRRGDGIRKKNARFDIPSERNLSNIDHLISQTTDEQEIKELKQQKRLLRNRQAALDSRQRKKLHTERLEDEKKQFTAIIGDLEDEADRLKLQVADMLNEKQAMTEYIDKLTFDKEELIRTTTIESGELRKKIQVLTQHVHALEAAANGNGMASPMAAHGHGFGNGYGDMDGLVMPNGNWDLGFVDDFNPMEAHAPAPVAIKQEMQLIPTKKATPPTEESDKPSVQSGLLFFILLCGAFCLSQNQSTTPAALPQVSEDVRVASATILEALAPAQSGVPSLPVISGGAAAAPTVNNGVEIVKPATGLDGVTPSMLGDLTDSLTQPTQAQNNEQLFGLTPAQYNGVTGQDYLDQQAAQPSSAPSLGSGRRNLAEALAAMRTTTNKAEVYTRSLLWENIPGDVVRDFARMIAEANQGKGKEVEGGGTG